MRSYHTNPSCPVITGGKNCGCHRHALHKRDILLLYQPIQISETPQHNVEKVFKEDTKDEGRGIKTITSKSESEGMNTRVKSP